MSYGSYSWEFEDLEVFNSPDDSEPKLINVGFTMICTHPGCAPSGQFGPPEYYDPGEGATWEIETIQLIFEKSKPLDISEAQFCELFPNGDDMITNAIEAAAENGEIDPE